MKLLAVECSASAASCCIFEDGKVLSLSFCNIPLTHSQTLLPMIESALAAVKLSINDIDSFAVANGPGSFTGIRIGISAVKGLALANNKPCIPVSTLYAMAMQAAVCDCVVCAVMDARCGQVYNANFRFDGAKATRLCPDRALMADELAKELEGFNESVFIVGDGAEMFTNGHKTGSFVLLPPHLRYQNAAGVAMAADSKLAVSAKELLPVYLRLPQAERELKQRRNEK